MGQEEQYRPAAASDAGARVSDFTENRGVTIDLTYDVTPVSSLPTQVATPPPQPPTSAAAVQSPPPVRQTD